MLVYFSEEGTRHSSISPTKRPKSMMVPMNIIHRPQLSCFTIRAIELSILIYPHAISIQRYELWASQVALSSVQFSRSVMSDSLRPHESQHARPPCPSPTPRVHSKNSPAKQGTRVQSLGREDPLEEDMTIHSSILTWKIPWTEEPGGLQTMRSQGVGHD